MGLFLGLVDQRRKHGGNDLFSHMCRGAHGEETNRDAFVRVFLTIMFGAFDTTAAALTSMAYLLAKHPDWQERLRAEAVALAPNTLEVSALRKLEQLGWAWKETLRLMPVSSGMIRRNLREVQIAGHTLPAGTLVSPMTGALGRDTRWWKEPARFDPERFSPARAEEKQHPAIHLPFGGGAHACVGMQLADLEMRLFWQKMLTRCRFSLLKDYEARHTMTPLGCVSGAVALNLEALR